MHENAVMIIILIALMIVLKYCDHQKAKVHIVLKQCNATLQMTKYKTNKEQSDKTIPYRYAIRSWVHDYDQSYYVDVHTELSKDDAEKLCAIENRQVL